MSLLSGHHNEFMRQLTLLPSDLILQRIVDRLDQRLQSRIERRNKRARLKEQSTRAS